jgi:translation initiation factor IF-2
VNADSVISTGNNIVHIDKTAKVQTVEAIELKKHLKLRIVILCSFTT